MSKSILLVVDVQEALVADKPYEEEKVLKNIKTLIHKARENGIEVVYVRHSGGKGDEVEYGTKGWQIYHEITPNPGEVIFDKHFNSAFVKTDLKNYLANKGIETIVLVGMQTEYCIDATCKSAFEHGFKVIIPEKTNTTYDNGDLTAKQIYEHYMDRIWKGRFARVDSMEHILGEL